ncbi:hypothetical protein [Streptomyces antibioticus]
MAAQAPLPRPAAKIVPAMAVPKDEPRSDEDGAYTSDNAKSGMNKEY